MRHLIKGKKFNRNTGSRKALLKVMMKNFFTYEMIETTLPKAKYVKPEIEKLITKAKQDDLATRRLLISVLNDKKLVDKLLTDIGPRFKDRNGGYTRIIKTGFRQGDMAKMAKLSLVVSGSVKEDEKSKKAKVLNNKKLDSKAKTAKDPKKESKKETKVNKNEK